MSDIPSGAVGGARGSISIDVSQLATARAAVQAFATGVSTSLGGINPQISKTQSAFASLSSTITQIGGAIGIGFGVSQLGRLAVDAAALATAYNRQGVAARNLAGGQAKLNDLLGVYEKATGGAVDKATALQNVTKLMAVGFADSSGELEQFTRAIRGISLAMGTNQDTVTQNLILELFTQRGARLDQLGLQYDVVRQRADELQASDRNLTQAMAYQQAVLEQAEERFGKLADSVEGGATGLEQAARAWTDLKLALGELAGSTVLSGFGRLADEVDGLAKHFEDLRDSIEEAKAAMGGGGSTETGGTLGTLPGWATHNLLPDLDKFIAQYAQYKYGVDPKKFAPDLFPPSGTAPWGTRGAPPSFSAAPLQGIPDDVRAIQRDWARGMVDVQKQADADMLEEQTSFGERRADAERNYQKSVSRAAEDFALSRQRQEQELADSITDLHADATRREQRMAEDLSRSIGQAQADSAERIASAREDANERLAELDANYEKERIRRAEDLSDNLLDAAGTLNARQVYELQRNAARQEEEAKEAHDDAREKIQEQLAERIDDERKSLDKSIRQQQDAYDRQLQDQRAADALRIQDMQDDFAQRRQQEDADYAKRMERMAQDHADQLAEMDRAHGVRLNQIRTHAIEERAALQEEADKALIAAHAADEAMMKRHAAREKAEEDLWDKFHKHIGETLGETTPRTLSGGPIKAYALGGYVDHTGLALLHSGEYVVPASQVSNSRSANFNGDVHLTIAGSTNMGREEMKRVAVEAFTEALEGAA